MDTAQKSVEFLKRNNVGSTTFIALDKVIVVYFEHLNRSFLWQQKSPFKFLATFLLMLQLFTVAIANNCNVLKIKVFQITKFFYYYYYYLFPATLLMYIVCLPKEAL